MSAATVLKREVRVALSKRGQPVWFRVLKWTIIVVAILRYWRHPNLWFWILGAFGAGVALHLFWRWKTRGWTQPWGGWNDVQAGR